MQSRWSCPNCSSPNSGEHTACRKCKFEPVGLKDQSSPALQQNRGGMKSGSTFLDVATGIAVLFLVVVAAIVLLVLGIVFAWNSAETGHR